MLEPCAYGASHSTVIASLLVVPSVGASGWSGSPRVCTVLVLLWAVPKPFSAITYT